jgi:hypothetical protein
MVDILIGVVLLAGILLLYYLLWDAADGRWSARKAAIVLGAGIALLVACLLLI